MSHAREPETPGGLSSWLGDLDRDLGPDDGPDDVAALAAARRFRDVLGRFASGVTVVTAMADGRPVGMTCQAFASVSLDPPLVLFVPARTSRTWPLIERAGRFCVNLLAADQRGLSDVMAGRGADKFAGLDWTPSAATGSPTFPGTLGHVDCAVHAVHDAGDHHVVIGRVLDLVGTEADRPLLYFRGAYGTTR
ncbi:flavin reductase family protein [Nocardioides marinquilinus]|uniref:Flavin reductase family protein n=1 Tax=Nocardioides marinquilinus TaxID=1210400 RepID=A0ABP9PSD0_9ACTN